MKGLIATSIVFLLASTEANAQATQQYAYDALGRLSAVIPSNGGAICYSFDAADNRTSVVSGCSAGLPATLTVDPAYGVNGHYPGLSGSLWGPNYGSYVPLGDAGVGAVNWRWVETLGSSQLNLQVLTGPTYTDQRLTVRRSNSQAIIYDSTIAADGAWVPLTITLPAGVTHIDIKLEDPSSAWGTWSAIAPFRFSGLTDPTPGMPNAPPTVAQPAWSSGGTWPDSSPWGTRWSSHVGYGDAGTGYVRWDGLSVQVGRRVEFLVQTGPTTGQQKLILRNAATGVAFVDMNVTDTIHAWTLFTFDIPQGITSISVEAQDNGSGWGEWIALTSPRLV